MTLEFKTEIAGRVKGGETMQSVANAYGVSRERIRQIALLEGVTGASVRERRRNDQIEASISDIIERREQWIPARFSKRPFTQVEFETHLRSLDPKLYQRWLLADSRPISRSGRADPTGQICVMCNVHKPWDEFYSDRSRPHNKAVRCVECSKRHADEIRRARHVTEPTVTRKICLRCGKTRAASKFSKSLTSPSGLQQYCKQCQSDYEKRRRAE